MMTLENTQTNQCLIAIRSQLSAGFNSLKERAQSLNSFGEVLAISGIYRKMGPRATVDSDLWVVVKFESTLTEVSLIQHLADVETEKRVSALGQYIMLSFNDMVRVAPPNPLPHPLLQDEPVVLTCAAESWGQYTHPILKRTLFDLFTNFTNREPLEFYAQGKTLL